MSSLVVHIRCPVCGRLYPINGFKLGYLENFGLVKDAKKKFETVCDLSDLKSDPQVYMIYKEKIIPHLISILKKLCDEYPELKVYILELLKLTFDLCDASTFHEYRNRFDSSFKVWTAQIDDSIRVGDEIWSRKRF